MLLESKISTKHLVLLGAGSQGDEVGVLLSTVARDEDDVCS